MSNLLKTLSELAEEQESFEKAYDREADEWWNNLDKDQQLLAFYSVVKRIVDGELVQKGSYRYVLYEVFRFGTESYMIGMNCGYMALHNAVCEDEVHMTNHNNGQIHGWNGGDCPVHPETVVMVWGRNGLVDTNCAKFVGWEHNKVFTQDIIAFQVVKEYLNE